ASIVSAINTRIASTARAVSPRIATTTMARMIQKATTHSRDETPKPMLTATACHTDRISADSYDRLQRLASWWPGHQRVIAGRGKDDVAGVALTRRRVRVKRSGEIACGRERRGGRGQLAQGGRSVAV